MYKYTAKQDFHFDEDNYIDMAIEKVKKCKPDVNEVINLLKEIRSMDKRDASEIISYLSNEQINVLQYSKYEVYIAIMTYLHSTNKRKIQTYINNGYTVLSLSDKRITKELLLSKFK